MKDLVHSLVLITLLPVGSVWLFKRKSRAKMHLAQKEPMVTDRIFNTLIHK